MFNLEEFENDLILEKVDKLNKYLSKNKIDKISKILDEFQSLIDQQEFVVQITYILSILAENRIDLISERLIQKIEVFLQSENVKLGINSIIIIGFAMIANSNYIDKYSQVFVKLLLDKSEDIRNNIHYFLLDLVEIKPDILNSNIDILLKSFKIEKSNKNILSLLNFLDQCKDFEFNQLYIFRNISKSKINIKNFK